MKHRLQDIQPVAMEIWEGLLPYCSIVKIAGSIRRRCDECKDIEIVALPNDRNCRNKIGTFFMKHGTIKKGKFTGRYVQLSYKGFPVDLFFPQAHDYYRQLAIRTGSAEFSKRIANAWVKKGYVGGPNGLEEVSHAGEHKEPPTWPSEKAFFKWLGIEWVEPRHRI